MLKENQDLKIHPTNNGLHCIEFRLVEKVKNTKLMEVISAQLPIGEQNAVKPFRDYVCVLPESVDEFLRLNKDEQKARLIVIEEDLQNLMELVIKQDGY